MNQRLVGVVAGALLVLAACSSDTASPRPAPTGATSDGPGPSAAAAPATSSPGTETPTTDRSTTTTTAQPTTTTERSTTTTARPTTTSSTTAPSTTTTTTTTAPPLPVHNPACVVEVRSGDSLSLIADGVADEAVTVASLQLENGLADPNTIRVGAYLDICPGNDVDDITGDERVAPPPPPAGAASAAGGSGVQAQQRKLNELFAGYGLPALAVDGDSGRLTEQQLCAARVALGLPVTRADMEPGGSEEQALMAAGALAVPSGAPVSARRWVLIDRTCQVMFVGEASSRVVFVFPTSTGEPGHETRDQNGSRVFRYDPARDNGGWHDSSVYPVGEDNPLNGNMYLPLYFDNGQAIHGANNVPPEPRSKGCARLRVEDQDALIDWLGLRDVAERIWDVGRIDLSVSVQGQF